jgi:DNA polymerase I
MKDPLDYSDEELKQLSKEELNELAAQCDNLESLYNTSQLVQKLLINSLYGAIANKYFPLYNQKIAAAITGNGRYFIQKLANYIENELQRLLPSQSKYIIYGDTDSCLGETIVKTSNGDLKIEDLYDSLDGRIEIKGVDNFIKHITTPIRAASVNKDKELVYNNISYVMKHKVKKRMYKIKCNGDDVTITEDHSMMVVRNDKLIEIKPKDVQKEDKLIKIL